MNRISRAEYVKYGVKLTVIGLLTIIFILCLSFEDVYGATSSIIYLSEPDLSQIENDEGPQLGSYFVNDATGTNYLDSDRYLPFYGDDDVPEDLGTPGTVPEPTTILLLGLGLAGAGLVKRRTR